MALHKIQLELCKNDMIKGVLLPVIQMLVVIIDILMRELGDRSG
jgi:hypothetical protein